MNITNEKWSLYIEYEPGKGWYPVLALSQMWVDALESGSPDVYSLIGKLDPKFLSFYFCPLFLQGELIRCLNKIIPSEPSVALIAVYLEAKEPFGEIAILTKDPSDLPLISESLKAQGVIL